MDDLFANDERLDRTAELLAQALTAVNEAAQQADPKAAIDCLITANASQVEASALILAIIKEPAH